MSLLTTGPPGVRQPPAPRACIVPDAHYNYPLAEAVDNVIIVSAVPQFRDTQGAGIHMEVLNVITRRKFPDCADVWGRS